MRNFDFIPFPRLGVKTMEGTVYLLRRMRTRHLAANEGNWTAPQRIVA